MLLDFQKRMVEEFNQLDERLEKLNSFIGTDKFYSLDPVEQKLQMWQFEGMVSYHKALRERCLHQGFNPSTGNEVEA